MLGFESENGTKKKKKKKCSENNIQEFKISTPSIRKN